MKERSLCHNHVGECGAILPLTAIAVAFLFLIILVMTQFLIAVEDSVRNVSNVTQAIIQMTRNLPNRKAAYDAGIWSVLLNQDLKAEFPPMDRYENAREVALQINGKEKVWLSYTLEKTARVNVRSSETTTFLTEAFLGFLKIFETSAELGGEPSRGALFFAFDNSFSMRGAGEDMDAPPDEITTPIRNLLVAADIPVATRGEDGHFCYPISMEKIEQQMGRDLSFEEEVEMCYYLSAQLPFGFDGRALPLGLAHWNSERKTETRYEQHRGKLIPPLPLVMCDCDKNIGSGCPSGDKLAVWGYNPAVSLEKSYCEHLAYNTLTRVCGTRQLLQQGDAEYPVGTNLPGYRTTLFNHSTCPANRFTPEQIASGIASSQQLCQPLLNPNTGQSFQITDGDICRPPWQHNDVFLTGPEMADIRSMTNTVQGASVGEVILSGAPVSQYVRLTAHFSDFWITAKQLAQSALIGLSERFPYLGFYVFSAPNPYGTFQERGPNGEQIRGVFEFHNWRNGNIYERQIHLLEDLMKYRVIDANGQDQIVLRNLGTIFPQVRLNESLSYLDHEEFPNINPKPGTKPHLEPVYKYSHKHSLQAREYLNVIDNPLRPFPSRHGAMTWELEKSGYPGIHPGSFYLFPVGAMNQLDLDYEPGEYSYFPKQRQNPVWNAPGYQIHSSWSGLGNTSKPIYSFGNLKEIDEQTGYQGGAALATRMAINNPVGAFAYLTPSLGGTNTHELFAQFADDCNEYRQEMNDSQGACTAFIITDGEPRVHAEQQAFNQLAAGGGPALTAATPLPFGSVGASGTLMNELNNELLRFEGNGNTFVFLIFIQHQETLGPEAQYFLSLFDPTDPNGINTNPKNRALFQIDYENPDDFRSKMTAVLRLAIVFLSRRSELVLGST